jgi:2-polyprenyl-3-methyl-5-hydroxy-6-metoxy-1,4-benzoquinol methylase
MKNYRKSQIETTRRLIKRRKRKVRNALIERHERVASIVSKYSDKNKPLIELGVLEGLLFDIFKRRGFVNLYGIDISPDAIERLRERGYEGNVTDAQEFISSKKFDTVVSCHMLEHCPRPQRVIQNIYDILNEGGILYIEVPLEEKSAVPDKHGHWFKFENTQKLKSFFPPEMYELIYEEIYGAKSRSKKQILVFRRME